MKEPRYYARLAAKIARLPSDRSYRDSFRGRPEDDLKRAEYSKYRAHREALSDKLTRRYLRELQRKVGDGRFPTRVKEGSTPVYTYNRRGQYTVIVSVSQGFIKSIRLLRGGERIYIHIDRAVEDIQNEAKKPLVRKAQATVPVKVGWAAASIPTDSGVRSTPFERVDHYSGWRTYQIMPDGTLQGSQTSWAERELTATCSRGSAAEHLSTGKCTCGIYLYAKQPMGVALVALCPAWGAGEISSEGARFEHVRIESLEVDPRRTFLTQYEALCARWPDLEIRIVK